jgi:hypothetical protein
MHQIIVEFFDLEDELTSEMVDDDADWATSISRSRLKSNFQIETSHCDGFVVEDGQRKVRANRLRHRTNRSSSMV